jgi:hypothetical protein
MLLILYRTAFKCIIVRPREESRDLLPFFATPHKNQLSRYTSRELPDPLKRREVLNDTDPAGV